MAPLKAGSRVLAGTIATVLLSVLSLPLLPVLGIATAEIVDAPLSPWILTVPLAICAVAGGAITGAIHGETTTQSTILGSLAGGLGGAVIGVVLGGVLLLVALGMTPAHGQEPNLLEGARTMTVVGGGTGFVAGAIFGAVGGVGGHVVRRELGG
ncbi:hypothetical protein [Halobaculum marinum]|uniref:Uncharacterized protein n=1 Tax=Halobaculum marinum TaxID=3031996 RepID=A0ABD5WX10_9EURY|nr:hypothetical protein [Halobaculum sp. DT55]